jgi:hypothetical protein
MAFLACSVFTVQDFDAEEQEQIEQEHESGGSTAVPFLS